MFTPTAAAIVVTVGVEKRKVKELGLIPEKPYGQFVLFLLLALVIMIALPLLALPVGAALGVYHADLTHFSGYAQQLGKTLPMDVKTLVIIQLATLPLGAIFNVLVTAGEEIGWRCWLFPKLLPLGPLPAIIISGIIWGLWHAPVVLLGYNYPGVPGGLALLAMCGMCIVYGGVLAWLRMRSQSVWPAALGHGVINAAGGTALLFASAGQPYNPLHASLLGWSGWIIPAIMIAILLVRKQFTAPQPNQ